MLYPPVWLPNPPQWQNYVILFTERGLGTGVINSIFVTTLTIIGTVISSSLAAYGFARLRMPGKNVVFMLLLSTLMLPSIVLIIPQFMLFQRFQWINTFYPLIVPAFFGNAFYIFLLRQFLISVPRDLEEAAWIDGAGYLRTFFQVAVPMIWPAMIAVAVYTFVGTWNDFLTPLIYLSDESKYTLSIALRYLQGSTRSRPETQLAMAAATVAIIPCVLVFLAAQRWFVQGTVVTGVKG
jgi:multiple sugar transport system permease protein/sn-glycerol 3-phosphate transport system permease protein